LTMGEFKGFPARMEFTPIPNLFFSAILPKIDDIAELKITLHLLAALYRKRGYPRFVTYQELLGDAGLVASLKRASGTPEEALRRGLALAVKRGTIIQLTLERDGESEEVYLLNTESDRQAAAKIESGELKLGGLGATGRVYLELEEPPNVFAFYEENIGVLTPAIAEELREAEKLYPEAWIREAIKEAVSQNVRKWSYISAILERWAREGKSHGAYQRYPEKGPDKYLKQKYGHMVRR